MQNKLLYYKSKISDKDFKRVSEFVESKYGIKLPAQKKAMVQNRLYRRLIALEIETFDEYFNFVFSPSGSSEISLMIDEITTNKTDFFREIKHFNFLEKNIIPKTNKIKVWSAGCSTGEEPYSLAMLFDEKNIDYNIWATDLSCKSIEKAKAGCYNEIIVKDIPRIYLKLYFDEEKNKNQTNYRVKQDLSKKIRFSEINLKETPYNLPEDFDIIFFRNVLIYFNFNTQNQIISNVIKHLKPGGYLFIGHSEAIFDNSHPLKYVAHSVFQKI